MEFRLPFNSAKPPFYVSLNSEREIQTWDGPYGTHDADFNWGSRWGDILLENADNKDATNAVEVLYLKDIPKRSISSEADSMWITNSRVQMQVRPTDYGSLDPELNNKIEVGIRECDVKHRPWDGLTIEVTGYIEYGITEYPFNAYVYDVVFEFVLAKEDFQTTPVIPSAQRPYGLGYDPDKSVFWFLIDGPEVPSCATWSYYTIGDILSVTPSSPFEPPVS